MVYGVCSTSKIASPGFNLKKRLQLYESIANLKFIFFSKFNSLTFFVVIHPNIAQSSHPQNEKPI